MRPLPKAVFRIAVCVAAELAMVVVVQFQLIVVKDRPFTVALVGILAVLIVSAAWGRCVRARYFCGYWYRAIS